MSIEIEQNVSLAAYTTLKVGGVADYLVRVTNVEELEAALVFAQERTDRSPLVIGGGSNLLVSDEGYRGLVIKNDIAGREYDARDDFVIARIGAGEELDAVIDEVCAKGWWGIENLSAIPGSVGATPVQNVGAYGVEVSDVIESVSVMHMTSLERKRLTVSDCEFGYRDSFFKSAAGREWIITDVTFALSKSPRPKLDYGDLVSLKESEHITPVAVRECVVRIRAGKFPDWRLVGTAGSFFKNPIVSREECERLIAAYPGLPSYVVDAERMKLSLGWILDHVCGLRGYAKDGVELFEKQALVLVNRSAHDARTIDAFANDIARIVETKTNIRIEREVRMV